MQPMQHKSRSSRVQQRFITFISKSINDVSPLRVFAVTVFYYAAFAFLHSSACNLPLFVAFLCFYPCVYFLCPFHLSIVFRIRECNSEQSEQGKEGEQSSRDS
jgi:hypothetical protein